MRIGKRAKTKDIVLEKEWYQKLIDEEGECTDPNIRLFFQGDYIYTVNFTENTVSARDIDGDNVGELSLRMGSDDNCWLSNIEVDDNLQRNGIATELVRLAVLYLEDFFIAGIQESVAYEFSLSHGGANLINACLRRGFINEDNVLFPPKIPPLRGNIGVDPGLIVGVGRIGEIYTERTREEEAQHFSDDERCDAWRRTYTSRLH